MLRVRLIDEPNAISTDHANPLAQHARAYYGKFINGLAMAQRSESRTKHRLGYAEQASYHEVRFILAEIRRKQSQACLGYAEQASHHEVRFILADMRRTIE